MTTAFERLAAALAAVSDRLPTRPIVLTSVPELATALGRDFACLHGPPGRNIALAVGLRAAQPTTPILLAMNADGVTLGTNHLIHAARRNVGMTLLLLRSELTGGAAQPHPDRALWEMPADQVAIETRARPLEWVSALDAALVGRANLDVAGSVEAVVGEALATPGFSVVGVTTDPSLATGVLSRCEWPEHFAAYRDWAKPLAASGTEPAGRDVEATKARRVPRLEVRIAGLGGHGVKLAGTVLSEAAGFDEGLWATQRGDYGSATRGGPSSVDVVIGSDPITYPGADHPDALVVLSQAAADRWAPALKPGAKLICDPAEVKRLPEGAIAVPITALAREHTGKPLAAGVVALGCVAALTDAVGRESLERSLARLLPRESVARNVAACAAGYAATRAALDEVVHG